MCLTIKVLPASPGDSLLITYKYNEKTKNILIDGGIGETYYAYLKNILNSIKLKREYIDLLVITHIDYDHIEGICRLFEDDGIDKGIIKRVWFNSGGIISEYFNNTEFENRNIELIDTNNTKQSVRQGMSLEGKLEQLMCWSKEVIIANKQYKDIDGIEITILSPNIEGLKKLNSKWEIEKNKNTKMASSSDYNYSIDDLIKKNFVEDKSVVNESSIAMLLEYEGKKIVLAGDAKPSVILASLNHLGFSNESKMVVDVFKVSHHGSKKNTSGPLLDAIKCKNFIISSDSRTHGLPNKECLARIINSTEEKVNLFFNYEFINEKNVFTKEDHSNHKFECYSLNDNSYHCLEGRILLWK